MSLYDPCGSSEDGEIVLVREDLKEPKSMDIDVAEWKSLPGTILLRQGPDRIVLDAKQVEELYQILKHNR